MTTKQGRIAFGLKMINSSRFEYIPECRETESYDAAADKFSSSTGTGTAAVSSAIRFTLPAMTRHTNIASRRPSPHSKESWALPLLAVVRTPAVPPGLHWNPWRMTLQTPQPGMEPHKPVEPREPRSHNKALQWKRNSSLPSAAQRGFFLVLASARVLTASRQSSKRWMVRWVLWTFNIRWILQMGRSFFSQLDLKIISTIFRPESSGPNSETIKQINKQK